MDSVSWDLVANDVIMVTVCKLKLAGQNKTSSTLDVGVLVYDMQLHSYPKTA